MATFDKGHALVIGVGEYDEPRLRTPMSAGGGTRITVADAQGVAEALKNPNVCAYPPTQVTFLPDAQTTTQGITDALGQLAHSVEANDTVIIFFCGHGSPGDDGEYYLGTRDVRLAGGKFQGGTGLSKTALLALLHAIKAQKLLLIINACFSGSIGATLAVEDDTSQPLGAPPPADIRKELLGTGEGRAIITASRSSQYSRFDPSQANTYFGKALIDSLNGNDIRSGQYIGLYELYEAVYNKVRASTANANPIQEPVLTIVDEVGPFPVALGGKAGGTLGAGEIEQEPPRGAVERIPRAEINVTGDNATVTTLSAGRDAMTGGIHVEGGGHVEFGGDFVGRDKNVYGDEVRGDKITVNYGTSAADLAALFKTVYQSIDNRLADASVDKDVLKATVGSIEREAKKGDEANSTLVEKSLKTLALMAKDIFDVTVAALVSPGAAVAMVVKQAAEKAKREEGG